MLHPCRCKKYSSHVFSCVQTRINKTWVRMEKADRTVRLQPCRLNWGVMTVFQDKRCFSIPSKFVMCENWCVEQFCRQTRANTKREKFTVYKGIACIQYLRFFCCLGWHGYSHDSSLWGHPLPNFSPSHESCNRDGHGRCVSFSFEIRQKERSYQSTWDQARHISIIR